MWCFVGADAGHALPSPAACAQLRQSPMRSCQRPRVCRVLVNNAGGGCGLQLQCVARMSCGSSDQRHQGPGGGGRIDCPRATFFAGTMALLLLHGELAHGRTDRGCYVTHRVCLCRSEAIHWRHGHHAPAHRSLGVSLPVPADLCRRVPCSDEGRGVAGRSRLCHEGRKLFHCRAGTCAHLLTSSRACGREQSVAMGMRLGGRERPQVQHDTLCSARHRYRCDGHFGR